MQTFCPFPFFLPHSCLCFHTSILVLRHQKIWRRYHLGIVQHWEEVEYQGFSLWSESWWLRDSIIWVCLCSPSHWTMWRPAARGITTSSTAFLMYMAPASTLATNGTDPCWSPQHEWMKSTPPQQKKRKGKKKVSVILADPLFCQPTFVFTGLRSPCAWDNEPNFNRKRRASAFRNCCHFFNYVNSSKVTVGWKKPVTSDRLGLKGF